VSCLAFPEQRAVRCVVLPMQTVSLCLVRGGLQSSHNCFVLNACVYVAEACIAALLEVYVVLASTVFRSCQGCLNTCGRSRFGSRLCWSLHVTCCVDGQKLCTALQT
jgi:hypothetical protein